MRRKSPTVVVLASALLTLAGPGLSEEGALPEPKLIGPRAAPERDEALRKNGGNASTWRGWFDRTKTALLSHQNRTGWARGSWDPLGTYERQTGGRVFSTALAVLMLEQPYRHR